MAVTLVQSIEAINGTSSPALVATFPGAPTPGNLMIGLGGARPGDNLPPTPTDLLATGSVAGGTPWALQADAVTPAIVSTNETSSQRMSVFKRFAQPSEGAPHRYDPTSTQTNFRMIVGLMEFNPGDKFFDMDNARVITSSTEPTAVGTYSLSSPAPLPAEECLAVGWMSIRQVSTRTLSWHATNRPANDPFGEMEATNFICRSGWSVVTSPFTWTVSLDSSSAPATGIILLIPVESAEINNLRVGAETPSKLYVGTNEVSSVYKGSDLVMGAV